VPPGVRILSMCENPEQQWFNLRQEAMDRLRGENEALLRRLGGLEEMAKQAGVEGQVNDGQAAGPDLVPKESFELAMKEKLELEDVAKQKEKRLLRLQQVHGGPASRITGCGV
jgi:mitotic spindle assembly checkpoint protein MAD1